MAITPTVTSHVRMFKKRAMFGTLLLDNNYLTGGYLIPLRAMGFLRTVEEAQVHLDSYDIQLDVVNQRLVFYQDILLLVDGAVADGAATRVNVAVAGTIGANTGANISQPTTQEVPNGTNLAAFVAVPFWFIGF